MRFMARILLLALPPLVAMAATPPALAQGAGNAVVGRQVAERWCSNCHRINGPEGTAKDATSSFSAIAARPTTTDTSLRTFLSVPHGGMPDFSLSRVDIANVTTYILSLRGK